MNKSHPKYFKNENFFSIPNIQNCYWAGFIAADGCIDPNGKRVTFSQKSEDKILLERFIQDCEYTGTVYDILSRKATQLRIVSSTWLEDLDKIFNIRPRKSLVTIPPFLYQEDLIKAFIIGYIDGDGSIRFDIRKVLILDICGTFKMLKWIDCNLLDKNTIYKHSNIFRLRYTSRDDYILLQNLHQFAKENNLRPLERKWNKIPV